MLVKILIGVLVTVNCLSCLLLLLVTLMQRSKNDGIGATFGSGITESVFGAQTSNVLVKATTWLTVLFFASAVSLAYLFGEQNREKSKVQELLLPTATAPVEMPLTPAPTSPTATAPVGAVSTPALVPATVPAPETKPVPQPEAKPAKAKK